jgi:hypothetical protein
MSKIEIRSHKDIYQLKQVAQVHDEVVLQLHRLKHQGLVRHAVKYSMNSLILDGLLTIRTSPFESYALRRNKVDFWQVKYEVFGSLKDTIEVVEINAKEGKLVLRKKKHLYDYNGISFGIVFSGNIDEEPQLAATIKSISANQLNNLSYEILICGPEKYNPQWINEEFPTLKIRYLALDVPTSPRLMICDKKNLLYKSSQFNLVVISHCRILFANRFVEQVRTYPIEMATPAVFYFENHKEYKYLDIGFIMSYQDIQFGAGRGTIAGENVKEDYLHWYRRRVPFIDGGLNIFNKNVITEPPYNKYISWGEAEDVDVCNRLFQEGVLIDYLPEVKCFSATCKITGYNSSLKKLGRKVYNYFVRNGL